MNRIATQGASNNVAARKYNLDNDEVGFATQGDNLVLTEPQLAQLVKGLDWTLEEVEALFPGQRVAVMASDTVRTAREAQDFIERIEKV